MKLKGILFTILSALLFGVTPVLASKTYEMGSNAETLTFYRNAMVIPVIFIVILSKRIGFQISKKQIIEILIIGIMGRGITTLMLYASYQYVGISTATTLHFLHPVFVALICRIFYKEKLGKIKLIALIVASAGISFFMEQGENFAVTGIILAVASGLTYAFYMVGMDKRGLKDIDPFKLSFYMAIAVSVGMICYNIPTKAIVFNLSPKAMIYTFIVAICTSFFAVALLQIGIKYLSATTAAIFSLFEPITSSISGVLFLGEKITVFKIIGSIIILAAATILIIVGKQRKKAVS